MSTKKQIRCSECHCDRVLVYEDVMSTWCYTIVDNKCLDASEGVPEPSGKGIAICCSCMNEWTLTKKTFQHLRDMHDTYVREGHGYDDLEATD